MRIVGSLLCVLLASPAAADEVTAIGAGWAHTCALLRSGQVMCWGKAQPPDSATLLPSRIEGISDAIAIAVGSEHTCALSKGGEVRCWGQNDYGQCGDGQTRPPAEPALVKGIPAATALFAGNRKTCAVTAAGVVWCFGEGEHNEKAAVYTPSALAGRTTTALAMASEDDLTVALLSGKIENGVALSWGRRIDRMRLTGAPAPPPRRIRGLDQPVSFGGRECALLRSGKVACWGYRNYGQRGDGRLVTDVEDFDHLFVASRVQGLRDAVALDDGSVFSCAVRRTGQVVCWGTNRQGQLGNGEESETPIAHPVEVAGLTQISAVTAGVDHACALRRGGRVYCWGTNFFGQLGDGTQKSSTHPVAVRGLPGSSASVKDLAEAR